MRDTASADEIRLIVRADDMGMTHGCNAAVRECFEHGILTCAAIQAPAPWAEEAATMYGEHPGWCIGAHLPPMGEWTGYRWRPVLPPDQVPTLVDRSGFLPQSAEEFYARPIDYGQLEREFDAQVRMLRETWKVELGYVDAHYIDGFQPPDPAYAEVMRRVAKSLGLPLSEQENEKKVPGIFWVEPAAKEETLIRQLRDLTPGLWLLVDHLLEDGSESRALRHVKAADFRSFSVAEHRSAEARVLLSARVRAVIEERGIRLVSYRDLS